MLSVVARRLPVIQTPPSEDAEALGRPAWKWVLIGAGFTVTFWLPLATVAVWARSRALIPLSFIIAALLAGLLVGKFGPRARLWQVGLAGALGGLTGFVLAALGGGATSWLVALGAAVALVLSGGAFAALGGWLARARTRR